jgi:peptide/nickel transport system permease protein
MADLIKPDKQLAAASRKDPAVLDVTAEVAAPWAREENSIAFSGGGGRSPSRVLWLKLRRNRTAMIGLYTLASMYAAAILAGFLAPYKYDNARHDLPFHPPMLARIHVFDELGHMRHPFVYGIVPADPQLASYRNDTSQEFPIRFFVRGDSYRILWVISSNVHLFGVEEPGRLFLFGSDQMGQDIFSRILYGAQVSL